MYIGAGRDVWSRLGVTMLVGNGIWLDTYIHEEINLLYVLIFSLPGECRRGQPCHGCTVPTACAKLNPGLMTSHQLSYAIVFSRCIH